MADDHRTIPRIDFHTHFFYDRSYLPALLAAWDLRLGIINITGKRFFREPMSVRWKAMRRMKEAYPDRVALCTSMDFEGMDEFGFVDRIVSDLRQQIIQGACMVKVWKDVGLELRDPDGIFIQIDNERFQPIWDFLASEEIPVLAHLAEPKAAWLPLDERSPHYRYYRDNPQHHLYRRPSMPSWEMILEARDRWLEKNPDLTVIGAHFGSMAHDVALVAETLERFPNLYVDTAERFGDLVIQPSAKVRDFFIRYADRVLYGTDFIADRATEDLADQRQRHEKDTYVSLLRTQDDYLAGSGSIRIQDKLVEPVLVDALNLPSETLERVFHRNALRFLRFG